MKNYNELVTKISRFALDFVKDKTIRNFIDSVEEHAKHVGDLAKKAGLPNTFEMHDFDKFNDDVLDAYADAYAYRGNEKDMPEDVKRAVMKARKIHRLRMKHHPEYWYDKPETMDFESFCEMLCEWIATGIERDKDFEPRSMYNYYREHEGSRLDPIPSIKQSVFDWMHDYRMFGDRVISLKDFEKHYLKNNLGGVQKADAPGVVDLSK